MWSFPQRARSSLSAPWKRKSIEGKAKAETRDSPLRGKKLCEDGRKPYRIDENREDIIAIHMDHYSSIAQIQPMIYMYRYVSAKPS
jgi:hypothetical protein